MNADENKVLPDKLLNNRQTLDVYLATWSTEPIKGRSPRQVLKTIESTRKLLRLKKVDARFIRNWFLEDLEESRARLRGFISVYNQSIRLGRSIKTIEKALVIGSPEKLREAWNLIVSERKVEFETFVREMRMRSLPRGIIAQLPNLQEELGQAGRLVKKYQATRGFTFAIPSKDNLEEVLDEQRERPVVQRKTPKSERILEILDILGDSTENPFIPIELAEGMNLKALIDATDFRTKVVEARQRLRIVEKEYQKTRQTIEKLRLSAEAVEATKTLRSVLRQRDTFLSELQLKEKILVEKMEELKLTINPRILEQSSELQSPAL